MDSNIKDKLLFPRKDASVFLAREEIKAADEYCKAYIPFLNAAKTEREAVSAAVALAEKEGFVPWKKGMNIKSGDKVYFNRRGKAVVFCTVGKKSFTHGISIAAAHIDSPRLDLKMRPLYEDSGMAFFDTHYYGIIKRVFPWPCTVLLSAPTGVSLPYASVKSRMIPVSLSRTSFPIWEKNKSRNL